MSTHTHTHTEVKLYMFYWAVLSGTAHILFFILFLGGGGGCLEGRGHIKTTKHKTLQSLLAETSVHYIYSYSGVGLSENQKTGKSTEF